MKFSDLNITHDFVIGKRIEISEIIGKKIMIDKAIIEKSKFNDKNKSGKRMHMQISIHSCDEKYSCFTGSDILISQMEKARSMVDNDELFPIDTMIEKSGKCFTFK